MKTHTQEHKHQNEQPIQKLCKRILFYEVTRFRLFRVGLLLHYTDIVCACVSVCIILFTHLDHFIGQAMNKCDVLTYMDVPIENRPFHMEYVD